MTREELEKRLAKDPRFRLVRDAGKGFIIPAEAAPRPKDCSPVPSDEPPADAAYSLSFFG